MTAGVRWGEALKPCGTYAAYQRHMRRGEPMDNACRAANAAHVAAWRAEKAQEEMHVRRAADLRAATQSAHTDTP